MGLRRAAGKSSTRTERSPARLQPGWAGAAVLAPGYGGTAEQPLLVALARRLEAQSIAALPFTFSPGGRKPSTDWIQELADLREARGHALEKGGRPLALVGRSFGGRACARLALLEPPDALVLLSYPIRPPQKRRLEDEAVLAALRCPTLIVQGDADELGPMRVLRHLARGNPALLVEPIRGAGHAYGRSEPVALARAVDWLLERFSREASG